MVSRSYSNLLDLASGDTPSFGREKKRLPRVATVAGVLSELDDDNSNSVSSDAPSSVSQERMIIVGNQLPLRAHRSPDGSGGWCFSWDEDSLLLQLKDGLGEDLEVIYIGCLKEQIDPSEQDDVAQTLLETFKCVPAFIPPELFSKFYHGFCKQHLWPLFHYMLPLSPDLGGRFDRSLWRAYVSVNKIFADKVMEVISPEDDYVWVHDYHLMVLPTFLRKRFNRVKLGFFLHSPFPSSEIYRTLPVRDELLRALLNADLVGFHTFDYARHFLSCCSRMLGLTYQSKRGYVGLEYYGRTVSIKILPVGIHIGQLQSVLNLPETHSKVAELRDRFRGRTVILGVDDMDIFKGISLKLLAMEQLLKQHPDKRGRVVLVQIANPARGRGRDVQEVQAETKASMRRINETFGQPGYDPVVLMEAPLQFYERIAYYVIAECCLVTAVRDGMNLIPYEYVICRQGNEKLNETLGLNSLTPKKSMLVVSEFIGCSPSLSGAIRVNPWNIDAVAEAMDSALIVPEAEKQMRHEKHYRYVSTHDVAYWARSFVQDLERACRDHVRRRCWGIGFGLSFRVIALDPNFRKLSVEHIVSAYRRTNYRAFLLDYDSTMMLRGSLSAIPNAEAVGILNNLCRDPKNVVYIVSGKDRETLTEWFPSCEKLGIAAEHGYFVRSNYDAEWETCVSVPDFDWKQIAEPVMKLYTETTDGSAIETKESALVWNYQYADPDFGSCQAKELLDHLESVLANEPVSVKSGQHIVEVKPQVSSLVRSLGLSHHFEENSKPIEELRSDDGKVEQNPLHDIWMNNDGLLTTWLLGIIGEEVMGMLDGMDNAYQIWKSVEDQILPISKDKEVHLTQALMTIQKGTLSLDDYIRKFKAICDSLAAVRKPVDEVTKVFHLGRGLGTEYKDFRVAMLSKPPYPTYNQFILSLQSHEQMRIIESNENTAKINHEQAFFSQRGRGRGRGGRFNSRGRGFAPAGRFSYANPSHDPTQHNNSQWRNNQRQHGKEHTITCQICGKANHLAIECWNRFDHSYQSQHIPKALAAMQLNDDNDPLLYADSGATTHMLNDPGKNNNQGT